jgi:hypothetical protein
LTENQQRSYVPWLAETRYGLKSTIKRPIDPLFDLYRKHYGAIAIEISSAGAKDNGFKDLADKVEAHLLKGIL